MTTPAQAAYDAWMNAYDRINYIPFDQLAPWNKKVWTAIADAVIAQSKTIIAEEMAKAIFTNNDAEKMSALMWYAGKRTVQQRLDDDGKRAAKALRSIITQATGFNSPNLTGARNDVLSMRVNRQM